MSNIIFRILLTTVFILLLVGIIAFARGYRLNPTDGTINPTGIIVVSSYPNGAKIYINDKLKNATNANITLPPGKYNVELKKEGYFTFKKKITLKGEWVVKIDALLFPQNPSLSPLTSINVIKAFMSDDQSKIVLIAKGNEEEKEGIYLLETGARPLSIFSPLKLLVLKSALDPNVNLNQTSVDFKFDNKEFILTVYNEDKTEFASYLIDTNTTKQIPINITSSKQAVIDSYQLQKQNTVTKILETFKDPLPKIASDSFNIIHFSPDDTKILYSANRNTYLPLIINPPLIATNQTKEERVLQKGNIYVYDKKEDKNYFIGKNTGKNNIYWYPDSTHLVFASESHISISDYDNTAKSIVYSGPFEQSFICPTTDGKILILTNLNSRINKFNDIYSVGIR